MPIRHEYRTYLEEQTIQPATVNIYCNALDSLSAEKREDVYELDINTLNKLYQQFREGGDLREFNLGIGNQAPSAAIQKLIGYKQSITADNTHLSSTLENHMLKFKLVFPDFIDFQNCGSKYKKKERDYKLEAVEANQKLLQSMMPDFSNAIDIFLEFIELANFFNWRDKQSLKNLSTSTDFYAGIKQMMSATKSDNLDKKTFDEIKENLLRARVQDKKLAANMFLQIMIFPLFMAYPKKYFAMKSSVIRGLMDLYGYGHYKKGSYINYDDFQNIQRFATDILSQLVNYHPQDYIDIQSFLWVAGNFKEDINDEDSEEGYDTQELSVVSEPTLLIEPYSINDIINEGCFLDRNSITKILKQLGTKKNLILQGPPGTGKTWLAKKLAFALIGQKNQRVLRAVQFHPNLSYEDFIRGWRPAGQGELTLVDGPFLEMINTAKNAPNIKHVMVIEEINRGNPAQIFGEMLTLLEADKRTPTEALALSYSRSNNEERVYIPENLYIIGTMNIADRSLALVDLALRRRFAFRNLQPVFDERWKNWVHENAEVDLEFLERIGTRLTSLNNDIANDPSLGSQFAIGHSYVTPPKSITIEDQNDWFRCIVESEIFPLLEEYWYDNLERARQESKKLLEYIA